MVNRDFSFVAQLLLGSKDFDESVFPSSALWFDRLSLQVLRPCSVTQKRTRLSSYRLHTCTHFHMPNVRMLTETSVTDRSVLLLGKAKVETADRYAMSKRHTVAYTEAYGDISPFAYINKWTEKGEPASTIDFEMNRVSPWPWLVNLHANNHVFTVSFPLNLPSFWKTTNKCDALDSHIFLLFSVSSSFFYFSLQSCPVLQNKWR